MLSSRYAHAWALRFFFAGGVPICAVACSASDDRNAPANITLDGTVSSVGGTGTTGSSAQTTSTMTTGLTNGAASTVSTSGSTVSTSTTGTATTGAGGNASTSTGANTSASTSAGGAGLGGTDGATTTGDGGSTSGATTGSGGGTTTAPEASSGCGSPLPANTCTDAPCNLNGLDFFIDTPDDYDSMHPYPVVFQYHPLGGTAQQARTMYRVRPIFSDAIYVSPEGSDNGFPNTGGVDEDMTRAIIEDIETKFCIDKTRYFATGFSYGGSMSYTAGFCIGDIFRAIAPMAGATISGANSCDPARPVAAWINHGNADTALPIEMSITLRDRLLEKNGCSQETLPVDPSPCVAYQGCQAGYPVIWCEQEGVGHAIPDYGAAAIAEFFQQF